MKNIEAFEEILEMRMKIVLHEVKIVKMKLSCNKGQIKYRKHNGDRHVTNTCSNTACLQCTENATGIRTKLQRTKVKLVSTSFNVCHSKVSSWVSWVSSLFARSHPNWGHDWLIPPWSFRVNRVKSQRKQTIRDLEVLSWKNFVVLRTRLCPPLRGGPRIKVRTKKKSWKMLATCSNL